MSEINWGLATQPNSFENALTRGFQIGSAISQRREQKEYRDQQMQMQQKQLDATLAERQAAAAEKQEKRQQADAGTMRKLLMHAKTNPQQAFQAAQQLGIDTSRIPAIDSPEFQPWVDQQLFIADALEKNQADLPGLADEVMLALPPEHRNPESPMFRQAFTRALESKYAGTYVDEKGFTRQRPIFSNQQQASGIQEGATATNPTTGEKLIFRGGQWQPMAAEGGAGAERVGANFLDGL